MPSNTKFLLTTLRCQNPIVIEGAPCLSLHSTLLALFPWGKAGLNAEASEDWGELGGEGK